MDCYDYNTLVFHNNEIHNNERTPTDISTLLMTSSSLLLGISISMIHCYSSYFGLTKSNYFCFSLAFSISFHYQFWWMDLRALILSRVLLSGGICPAPVSLINIHKPCLSVYVWTIEILYIVQKYKLRMLMNTPILSLTS